MNLYEAGDVELDTLDLADVFGVAGNQDWRARALCAQVDGEIFYPEKGGSVREAKAVCARCPVREECLTDALTRGERFGVWGGLSGAERHKLAEARGMRRYGPLRPHGTTAAARRHYRAGEPLCDACKAAERRDVSNRGKARRMAGTAA